MGLVNDPTSQILKHVLRYQNARHDILTSNIANLNTPGYKAFDLVLSEQIGGGVLAPRRTDPRHLGPTEHAPGRAGVLERTPGTERLDGNDVSLDDQFMRLRSNRMTYLAAFELMDKWGGLYPVARELT